MPTLDTDHALFVRAARWALTNGWRWRDGHLTSRDRTTQITLYAFPHGVLSFIVCRGDRPEKRVPIADVVTTSARQAVGVLVALDLLPATLLDEPEPADTRTPAERARDLVDDVEHAVALRAMYTDIVGDAQLGEQFAELEEHLLNPDECDHGSSGTAGGCSTHSLRLLADDIGRTLAIRAEVRAGLDQATTARYTPNNQGPGTTHPATIGDLADEIVAWIDARSPDAGPELATAVLRRLAGGTGADLADANDHLGQALTEARAENDRLRAQLANAERPAILDLGPSTPRNPAERAAWNMIRRTGKEG